MLQDKEVSRLGSSERLPVSIRLIASSGKDLRREIRLGHFRSDLYYRINVLELTIPPLRERPEDIPLLAEHFLAFEKERRGGQTSQLSKPASLLLQKYDWPGNVRELENFCERLSILGKKATAGQEDLILALPALKELAGSLPSATAQETGTISSDERTELLRILDRFDGNRKKTAEYLNINPSTLWRRMKKLGL